MSALLAVCQGARDEVRLDVLSGEFYDTGVVLLCTSTPAPGLPFCSSCLPRSANRNAPYRVRSGYYLETDEQFPTFAEACARYAAYRAEGHAAELTGARVDLGDDGLDDDERETLGLLP